MTGVPAPPYSASAIVTKLVSAYLPFIPPIISSWQMKPIDSHEPSAPWWAQIQSEASLRIESSIDVTSRALANEFRTNAVSQRLPPSLPPSPKAENEPSLCLNVSWRW